MTSSHKSTRFFPFFGPLLRGEGRDVAAPHAPGNWSLGGAMQENADVLVPAVIVSNSLLFLTQESCVFY